MLHETQGEALLVGFSSCMQFKQNSICRQWQRDLTVGDAVQPVTVISMLMFCNHCIRKFLMTCLCCFKNNYCCCTISCKCHWLVTLGLCFEVQCGLLEGRVQSLQEPPRPPPPPGGVHLLTLLGSRHGTMYTFFVLQVRVSVMLSCRPA
jgi:hypothetical protein